MELDSIIYIIIAIVLAIVNAVAQKKKKPQQQAPLISDKASADESDRDEDRNSNPLDFLFGDDEEDEASVDVPYAQQETVEVSEPEQPQKSDYQQKMQEVAEQLLDNESAEIGSYDYDDNVIEESAIGNALTEEEQSQADLENRTDFIKEFNAKKAIIYSEVIKPKYFSVGVNS
ncbi:MAG: hypothetical protein ACLFNU_07615 [Bacteroidales bacterium]